MKKKVAVASTDGKVINSHFGRAVQFLIFEMNEEGFTLEEVRDNTPGCSSLKDATGSMEDTIDLIKDCDYVLVARIGQGMVNRLQEVGVEAITNPNIIEDGLRELVENL